MPLLLSLRMRRIWRSGSIGVCAKQCRGHEGTAGSQPCDTKGPYTRCDISSSVVNSTAAVDSYTETKKAREARGGVRVASSRSYSGPPLTVLVGVDRKHIRVAHGEIHAEGALSFQFLALAGFLRQPLYAADFCEVIISSILNETTAHHNITGQERIDLYRPDPRCEKRDSG